MSSTKKIWIGVGIAALLCIVAGFQYWARIYQAPPENQPTATAPLVYDSVQDGITFSYPAHYTLQLHELDITTMTGKYLTLIPSEAQIPVGGEGPPSITVGIFENPQKTPLADWLKIITNGAPMPASGWDFAEGTVAGENAIAYTATGLYESDNVAVAHGTRVYLFSASWMTRDEATLKDLEFLLQSVRFK